MSPGGRGFYLLRELSKLGYHPVVFTSNSNHLDPSPIFQGLTHSQSIEGVEVTWINTIKYKGANSLLRIASWVDFEIKSLIVSTKIKPQPEVIVASSLSLISILTGLILKRRYKARLIFEVRDIWPLTIIEEGGFNRFNPFVMVLSWIERIGYRYSDAVIGTMPNLIEHVRLVSTTNTPVYCIPMGYIESEVDASLNRELPESFLKAGLPKGKFTVGYAGTVGTTNALEVLFSAAENLAHRKDIHFVIVGTGDRLDSFKKLYSHLPNVTFIGSIPKEYVQRVLAEFDILYLSTFPSKVWDYGLSLNKLMDYMLAGKPVIASYSGFPSMLNESGSGVFVPAGDVKSLIEQIVNFSSLPVSDLQDMGKLGREWLLSNRSYKSLAKEYSEILFPNIQQTNREKH